MDQACIFQSSMSILVNGSPTEDFNVERGLRQGDPLSPFLFLIVAEGLAGMMRRVVEIGRFKGFHVNDNIQFQILQFADDTILMGEGTLDNLRTIKVLLRSFELMSGLKINFVKSKLYGFHVDGRFLEAGSTFLSCRSDVIPFRFLGIPVGANPRRKETWKPVVEAMARRLSCWNSRHLSFGGRITLINSPRPHHLRWFRHCHLTIFSTPLTSRVFAFHENRTTYPGVQIRVQSILTTNWNGVDPVWMWQWRDILSDIENRQLLELQNLLTELW
ncbi:ribonuclease H [Trifolium pratense]|uniref:Ribonuclease H n=1 Tax=Trifolium pratense TaxID=57577 RepID=A0A2K3P900_TRIPR|nr:ribonuclease H [Trifolium pratense]